MKKKYEKPMAVIQDMTVNCFVAGACGGGIMVQHSETTCVYDTGAGVKFFSFNCISEGGFDIVDPNTYSMFAGLCYHNPGDTSNFFSS